MSNRDRPVRPQRINDPDNPVPRDPLAILERLDRLDPSNQMPLEPNQQPCPGQRVPLSTERQASSIPKGGTSSTWLYPSPQMFYNSLKRKGKGEDVHEAVMDSIVASHNGLNEQTWRQVLVWESLHRGECGAPKLVRFMGKPHDMSPLARWRVLVGGPAPFDRHDWWVDRCGEEVRYVIDFYFDEARAGSPEVRRRGIGSDFLVPPSAVHAPPWVPSIVVTLRQTPSPSRSQAFEVVARPALDSFSNVLDRVKMSIYTTFAEYGLPCPVTLQGGRVGQEAQRSRQPSTA